MKGIIMERIQKIWNKEFKESLSRDFIQDFSRI